MDGSSSLDAANGLGGGGGRTSSRQLSVGFRQRNETVSHFVPQAFLPRLGVCSACLHSDRNIVISFAIVDCLHADPPPQFEEDVYWRHTEDAGLRKNSCSLKFGRIDLSRTAHKHPPKLHTCVVLRKDEKALMLDEQSEGGPERYISW